MKRTLLFTLLLSFTLVLFAQEEKTKLTRKERREIKKQEQKEYEKNLAAALAVGIDSQKWVLEANSLSNKRGSSMPVNSTLNFIALEGDEAFIQLGSNSGLGANGVGGVSVRARVTKYEVKKNEKKGTYFLQIYTSSAIGSFDIRMDCNSSGQIATATISGNTSRKVTYSGQLVPIEMSTVYKGTPII
ncbi:MAG: DUF4251 domain-containing protein [Marinilabiliaceae bacterium]|nr:DUF4251 domain-containing protein [Marinilabiliaceae bacterium]